VTKDVIGSETAPLGGLSAIRKRGSGKLVEDRGFNHLEEWRATPFEGAAGRFEGNARRLLNGQ
jgi:hypothetical protein